MENLTLEELNLIRSWYEAWHAIYDYSSEADYALIDKIKQAIADKEFEEKTRPLNF